MWLKWVRMSAKNISLLLVGATHLFALIVIAKNAILLKKDINAVAVKNHSA